MALVNGIVLIIGGGAVEDWEAGKIYKVNQLVKSDSKLYICMNEHTSSEVFATDLLAGNWAFVGGAGYSNVIMDTIYGGDVQVTATTGYATYTLTSSADSYDYAICTVKITETNGTLVKATAVVPGNSSQAISWSYGIGSGSANIEIYGWVSFTTDKASIRFALRAKGSTIASASLERVDGIKVNTMTLSEIAELGMPSEVRESIAGVGDVTIEYLCPANGYVFAGCLSGTATATNRTTGQTVMTPSVTSYYSSISIICKKGDVVAVNLRGSSPYANFCYSVGSAKELGLV